MRLPACASSCPRRRAFSQNHFVLPATRASTSYFLLLTQDKVAKEKGAPPPCPLRGFPALLGKTGAVQLNLRAPCALRDSNSARLNPVLPAVLGCGKGEIAKPEPPEPRFGCIQVSAVGCGRYLPFRRNRALQGGPTRPSKIPGRAAGERGIARVRRLARGEAETDECPVDIRPAERVHKDVHPGLLREAGSRSAKGLSADPLGSRSAQEPTRLSVIRRVVRGAFSLGTCMDSPGLARAAGSTERL
jgi:hypothetical protein